MKVIIVKDKSAMARRAAQLIAEDMQKRTPFVLGLATGSTPVPLYKEFIAMNKAKDLDFSSVVTFNLDEYVGLPPQHDQSYRYFMNNELFDHVNIQKRNTFVPDGMAASPEDFCCHYEAMIRDVGGIDYQVLGIGSNGHIAFNEPGSSIASRTRVVPLTENTRKDNARFFKSIHEVPSRAMTMGIGTILEARKVVLLACGENKTDAVLKALQGAVTAMVPASALQMHGDVTFVITEDAATKIKTPYGSYFEKQ